MALRNFFSILVKPKDKVLSQRCRPDVRAATTAVSALQELRKDPEAAINRFDFLVDIRKFTTTRKGERYESGGAATISEGVQQKGVTRLTVDEGGKDFYYPWVNRGVGEVIVPIDQPDGTIVVTRGMNGCALQVNRDDTNLIFYHDSDSKYLGDPKIKVPQGNKLCRIEPDDYIKNTSGVDLMEKMGGGSAFVYQMICIRNKGRWKIVYSGILIGPGMRMPIIRSFTPGPSKFLASFDESES